MTQGMNVLILSFICLFMVRLSVIIKKGLEVLSCDMECLLIKVQIAHFLNNLAHLVEVERERERERAVYLLCLGYNIK